MNQEEFNALLAQAEAGDVDAMVEVAFEYTDESSVVSNRQKGFGWFEKAANKKHDHAMLCLALFYWHGIEVKESRKTALYWFAESARLGNTYALANWITEAPENKSQWQPVFVKQLPVFDLFRKALGKIKVDKSIRGACDKAFKALLCCIDDVERDHFYHAKVGDEGLTHYTYAHVALNIILPKHNEKPMAIENIAGLPVEEFENLSCKLRIGMAVYLNDPTEGKYAFEAVQKDDALDVQEIQKRFERFYADDEPIATSHLPEQIFSLSFSKNRDNLNLWRAYGTTNGLANGVGLFIPNATFRRFTQGGMKSMLSKQNNNVGDGKNIDQKAEDFLLFEVRYGQEAARAMWEKVSPALDRLFALINNQLFPAPERTGGLYDRINALKLKLQAEERAQMDRCIVLALSRLIYLYKHEAYAAEQEVRAIALRSLSDAKLDERTPRRLYCDSPDLLFLDKGSSIILGPQTADKTALLWETRKRLALLGLDDKVSVTVSTVPFR
jgi:TPR repeat protein